MGKVSFTANDDKVRRKVADILEKTVIHQRQTEIALGQWDFLIFGPGRVPGAPAVARVCVARQALIQKAPLYHTLVGDPYQIGSAGMMPIEELTGPDIDDELRGLEIYHVSPLRPIEVTSRRASHHIDALRDLVFSEFTDKNIAIVETPDESAWGVAALRYLHECDETFPDEIMGLIKSKMRAPSADEQTSTLISGPPSRRYH
jgi:hypothetical protein